MQITVTRLLGIAGLGAVAVLIGLFTRWDDNPAQAVTDAVASYGLEFSCRSRRSGSARRRWATSVDDRLLVYLWLKPVARWQLPAAAVLATATVVVPLTAVPLAASGDRRRRRRRLLLPRSSPVSFAAARVRRSLRRGGDLVPRALSGGGFAFVLLWENVVAHTAEGAARFTVNGWAASVLDLAPDVDVSHKAGSAGCCVRRAPGDCSRRLAGGDLALPPRRRGLTSERRRQAERPGTTRRRTS